MELPTWMGLQLGMLILCLKVVCQATASEAGNNVTCPDPVQFVFHHGVWKLLNPRTVYYSCQTGYTLHGPIKQECSQNGTWDPPETPTCVDENETVYCEKPEVPNGNIKYRYGPGEIITVQCDNNYLMNVDGKPMQEIDLYCSQDHQWVTEGGWHIEPLCKLMCSVPPDIPHSRLAFIHSQIPNPAVQGFLDGEVVFYVCNTGYTLVDAKDSKLVCQHGEWVGDISSCVSIEMCHPPDKVTNGIYFTPSKTQDMYNFKLGSLVTYRCDPGFKLLGSATLVCMEGPVWSHHPPQCIPDEESTQYCPKVDRILNGQCFCESKSDLSFCEPFYRGLHVECVCDNGYKLIGQSIVTCSAGGKWDYLMPTCVQEMEIEDAEGSSTSGQTRMSTLAIVVATACSVLGILLLIMVIMVFRRRKPHPPRLCRPSATPPPYSRVHSNSLDEHDRVLLIGYENNQIALPSYEEAVRGHAPSHFAPRSGQVGEYRPLPSIPSNLRSSQSGSGDISNRHSIITTSTMNRDGISEVFGSIDTVNVSMSDASTAVTVETLDSASSHHSNMSRRATAGSINSSNGSLTTEDVPLLEGNQRDDTISSGTNGDDVQDKPDN